jgi:hypothetical protein
MGYWGGWGIAIVSGALGIVCTRLCLIVEPEVCPCCGSGGRGSAFGGVGGSSMANFVMTNGGSM